MSTEWRRVFLWWELVVEAEEQKKLPVPWKVS